MKLIRSTLFYLVITGIGAGIIGLTQVVEHGGSAGLKERVLRLVEQGRALVGLAPLAPQAVPDQPAPLPEAGPELARLPFAPQDPDPPALADSCRDGQGGLQPVVIGDRLRLRFFEQARALAEGGTRSERDILYERLDLSGSFDVGAEGAVSLPLLGRVTVAGRDLACVESSIRLAWFEATRTGVLVNAGYEQRPQIVLRGAVRAPGVYAHAPGMTAGRLLGLAGAAAPVADLSARTALVLRGAELGRLQAEALGLQIERRRLAASLGGTPLLELTEAERAEAQALLGPARIEAEQRVLDAELAELSLARARQREALDALDRRVADMQAQDALAAEDLKQLHVRRDELLAFKARGFVSAQQLDSILFNVMVSERFRRGLQASLLDLGAAREAALADARRAEAERRRGLVQQDRDLVGRENELDRQIAAMEAELDLLRAAASGSLGGAGLVIAIQRQTVSGPVDLQADPQTPVLPGDLVTVSLQPEAPGVDRAQLSDADALILPVGAETLHD